ncbi:MAG: hypothetical protein H7311_08340, partial [Ramlibacter sp.]|nr:hypothetical protein [Cryobacterium sp.]
MASRDASSPPVPPSSMEPPTPPAPARREAPSAASRLWLPALAGVAAALAGLGAAELAAGLFAPAGSPILAVGAVVVDLAPAWLKELVISLFGTGDKVVLVLSVALGAAVLAAVAGVVEFRRPPAGRVIVAGGGTPAVPAGVPRADRGALVPAAPPPGGGGA